MSWYLVSQALITFMIHVQIECSKTKTDAISMLLALWEMSSVGLLCLCDSCLVRDSYTLQ